MTNRITNAKELLESQKDERVPYFIGRIKRDSALLILSLVPVITGHFQDFSPEIKRVYVLMCIGLAILFIGAFVRLAAIFLDDVAEKHLLKRENEYLEAEYNKVRGRVSLYIGRVDNAIKTLEKAQALSSLEEIKANSHEAKMFFIDLREGGLDDEFRFTEVHNKRVAGQKESNVKVKVGLSN